MLSELIEIRRRIDALIAEQKASSTTKKYTRSDEQIEDLLWYMTIEVIPQQKYWDVVYGRDFVLEN